MGYSFDEVRDRWDETEPEDFDMFTEPEPDEDDDLDIDDILAEADALGIDEEF